MDRPLSRYRISSRPGSPSSPLIPISCSIVRFCPPCRSSSSSLSLPLFCSRSWIETLLPLLALQQGNGYEQRVSNEGWAETEREKKTGSTVAVLAWRDHVRGFKELDPSACARFTQRNYARRVNERYTVYNSRLPVGFAGKKEKRQRGAMSSDQKRHLSTRGAIIFPAFRNLEYQSILNLETVIYI